MKTMSKTQTPQYQWKAEIISFLHVLLVWGVKLINTGESLKGLKVGDQVYVFDWMIKKIDKEIYNDITK